MGLYHAAVVKVGNLSNDVLRVGYVVLNLIDNYVFHKAVDIQQLVHQRQETCIGSQRHQYLRITKNYPSAT